MHYPYQLNQVHMTFTKIILMNPLINEIAPRVCKCLLNFKSILIIYINLKKLKKKKKIKPKKSHSCNKKK